MNMSSKSGNPLLPGALITAAIFCFSVAEVAQAEHQVAEPPITDHGILKEGSDQGFVDQKKRVLRNQDPRSPSPDSHVPPVEKGEDGRVLEDPSHLQGGPIGPN
jgi:hypothetical protein